MDDELERAMPEGVAGDTMLGREQRLAPTQTASDRMALVESVRLKPGSFDGQSRTFQAVFTTAAPVRRWFGNEILAITPDAIDLARLETGQVRFLDHHRSNDRRAVLGTVERAWIEGDGLVGVIRLAETPEAQEAAGQIERGELTGISVGYRVDKWQITAVDETTGREDWTARRWTLLEVSLVSVQADANAFVRTSPQLPAAPATPMETPMDPETIADPTRGNTSVSQPTQDAAARAAADAAVRAERERVTTITTLASRHALSTFGAEHVAAGTAVDAFRSALLDRLAGEKLKTEAEAIAAEGWKWIEVAITFPYGHDHGLRQIVGTTVDLSEEERATREALRDEHDRLEVEYGEADELPDEIDARLGEIEQALETFERRPMTFEPDQIGMAGVFISIDADGALMVERGYVRAEDETPAEPEAEIVDPETGEVIQRAEPEASRMRAVITLGGQPVETDEEDEADTIKPLPDRLVSELTAHRTLALRDAVAANPHVAMTALLHRLVMDCFMPHSSKGCLEAQVREVHLPAQAEDLRDSASAKAIADRHERWGDHVPADDAALWDWLTNLDDGSRMDLLAHCVSYGVNALYEKPNPYSGTGVSQHGLDIRLSQADRLARSTGLDMVAVGWRPTVGNYLGRVTKPRILEAVREGAGDRAADLIAHLKKGDMAKEAERLLAESGWLPEPLRMVDEGIDVDPASAAAAEADDLPDFLSGDGEDDPADEEEEQHMVAAE